MLLLFQKRQFRPWWFETAALRFNGQVCLFEFKVVELAPEGRALQQLKEKDYAARYRGEDRPIHLIGVEFSREQRTVVGFEVESEA